MYPVVLPPLPEAVLPPLPEAVLPPLPEAAVPPVALAPPAVCAPPVPLTPPDELMPPVAVLLAWATPPLPVAPPVPAAPPFAFGGEFEVLLVHAPIRTTHAHSPRCIFGFRVWVREFMSLSLAHGRAAWQSINGNHNGAIMTRTSPPES